MPQAASLAKAIKEKFDISVDLIHSGGGVFEVEMDGVLIFSKKAEGHFPGNEEIFASIEKRNPPQQG